MAEMALRSGVAPNGLVLFGASHVLESRRVEAWKSGWVAGIQKASDRANGKLVLVEL